MPTTIKLKNSVTTTSTPTSLAQGEVAINVTDKKVWVGNAATTPVQIVGTGSGGGGAAGSNTQVQFNNSGALAGSANLTFNGTTLVANDITDSSLTVNRVVYAGTAGNLVNSANFTFNGTTATLANDASISGLTVGRGAGAGATNTAVGASALGSNSGNNQNTAIGNASLVSNTTGIYNTAVGASSAGSITTGSSNTAIGIGSLAATTTASDNTAVGRQALYLSTGASNTAVGALTLYSNTTANNNTAVGYQAGYANTVSANNTYIGYQAGYNAQSGASESNNTFVGRLAGYSVTTGVSNTFYGQSAGYDMTTGSRNTIVGTYNGNQYGLDIRTASDYIVLSTGAGVPCISTGTSRTLALEGVTPKAGTGISFSPTQFASSDANTLDDYEEGTWTPSLGGTTTYTARVGSYVKVGQLVTVSFDVHVSAIGTGSTRIISGLPFTVSTGNSAAGGVGYYDSAATAIASIFVRVDGGANTVILDGSTAFSTASGTPNLFQNGTRIIGAITYRASA